jgi:pyruvate kinase
MSTNAQIVATIGPATKEKRMIKDLILYQMGVARLNFSWGTHEDHAGYIKNIRDNAQEAGKRIPIIQDLSGPRLQEKTGHEFNQAAQEVITAKDLDDLKFGIDHGVDYVAMSFVGTASDVLRLREDMQEFGKIIPIIAKIERKIAVDNIDEIIKAADAIMVARGDLGNEIPLEQIPFVEKDIIEKCKAIGKPVIVATQMMLSMMENPVPTRAEVTDVAYAILSGADAVMLSEESASGKYPLETIKMMEKEILEAEKHLPNNFKINPL